jgi:thioesterase domain-containing protein
MQEIAADYVDLIRAVRPHGPYILTGLCSAGVIAFEAARQLQEAGESVPLVITADTVMPDCWSHQTFRQRVVSRVRALVRTNLHRIDQFRRGEASFVEVLSQLIIVRKSRVLDLAAWLGLIDSAQQGQDDRATWLFLCALDVAHENYAAPTPFSGEVVVFQSDQLECDGDPTFGWSRLVDGGVYVHRVPGWHGGIFQGEGPAEMAAFLQPLLEAADLKSEPGPLSAVRS